MRRFFTQAGLQKFKGHFRSLTLFAFDYDGTLTPLTSKLSHAKLTHKTQRLLEKLHGYVPIVIISGRSISDLKKLCSFTPTFFIGNHGLEGIGVKGKLKTNFYQTCQKWKKRLLKGISDLQGVELEDKKYSLAIHYRRARHKVQMKRLILHTTSRLHPAPKIVFGKFVINLLPASQFNKGVSLKIAMHYLKAKHAVYVGDDKTDEDVFRLPGNSILKIRIGRKNNSCANFYLEKHYEINRFLNEAMELWDIEDPELERSSRT
ncbi:MAG: trehalose-phosphatase [Deltaproteobacteria bacterium]|nr:trehalose-phosphatase [Deltaproteobacteria bacterium]